MQRRAFLIGGDYKNPDNALPGVRTDILAWKRFLMSSTGGCWYENEIMDLSGQSKAQILEALQGGRSIDYSFVCFSGHGYLAKDRFGLSMIMTLINDTTEMSERELNPASPWTMMVFDCGRKGVDNEKVTFSNEAPNMFYQWNTRPLFESELLKCEHGLVKVFADDEGQVTDNEKSFSRVLLEVAKGDEGQVTDNEKSFSRVLLEVAKGMVGACRDGVLRINDAVRYARISDAVLYAQAEMPPRQGPVYMGGRRLHHFPFAVKSQATY